MPASLKQQEFEKQLDLSQIRQYRKSGNMDILGVLYQKYMHLVYGVGLKYLKDRQLAQDMVMQVFEKLTIEAKKHDISNFRGWLYVIARNECLMTLRKEETDTNRFNNWQKEQEKFVESHVNLHPLDESEHLSAALKNCIENLKEEQKKCIRLFYFNNKTYREISTAEKMEVKKVKSHIQNGKRNLKLCLESSNVNEYKR